MCLIVSNKDKQIKEKIRIGEVKDNIPINTPLQKLLRSMGQEFRILWLTIAIQPQPRAATSVGPTSMMWPAIGPGLLLHIY